MTLDGDHDKRPRATDPSAAPAPRGRYLVFGASGYIGQHLVSRLLREDLPVRAVARRRAALEGRGWDRAELVEADALQPDTLPAALAGAEVAYYLVHSMAAGRDFGRLDRIAAGNFAGPPPRPVCGASSIWAVWSGRTPRASTSSRAAKPVRNCGAARCR